MYHILMYFNLYYRNTEVMEVLKNRKLYNESKL